MPRAFLRSCSDWESGGPRPPRDGTPRGGSRVSAMQPDGSPRNDAPARCEAAGSHATLQSGESAERGRAARRGTPRSSHGEWEPEPHRPDPVEVLRAQARSRVQGLVPIRYGRMLVSPFTFYRGAAAVMAADLAGTPASGIVVQACGDAHISNFGGFAAPDRRLIFGPNDFDETLPGPWEWDVKRMAASAEIAGRDVGLPADPAQVDRHRLRSRVPRGDARLRAHEPSGRLV